MAKQTGAGDSNYPNTTWDGGTTGSFSHPVGSGKTLDARTRNAPPVGADIGRKKKKPKARSSVNSW